jgi:hypothetical protein
VHIRAVHRGVTPGTPARALPQQNGVRHIANVDFPSGGVLNLGVALQAQIRITFD